MGLFKVKASYKHKPTSLVVLHKGESPTADIYLRHRLGAEDVPVQFMDINRPLNSSPPFPKGAFVVIVRYINSAHMKAISKSKNHLSGVAYLMDDDIPGALSDKHLPRIYAWYLTWFMLRWRSALAAVCSEIWVSSQGLEEKYGAPNVHRIDPLYIGPDFPNEEQTVSDETVTIFYHAEKTHRRDALWLRDIIADVQSRCENTAFEIIGRTEIIEAYQNIPRCRVILPMKWNSYLSYASNTRFDIGLAPLGASLFNAGRSFNKIFDITRVGAAGIYSATRPYADMVDDGVSGLLLGDDPKVWVEAIVSLANDKTQRSALHHEALKLCLKHNAQEANNLLFKRFRQ